MSISPISSSIVNLFSPEPVVHANNMPGPGGSFADIFTEAISTVNTNHMVTSANTLALLSGQTDDLAGIMIDGQKAEIALNLALSLRNKVLDAYTEIMRMQV